MGLALPAVVTCIDLGEIVQFNVPALSCLASTTVSFLGLALPAVVPHIDLGGIVQFNVPALSHLLQPQYHSWAWLYLL